MFTIKRNSSCVPFGILERREKNEIIKAISETVQLEPYIDVVIANEAIHNDEVYNKASLYIELFDRPAGIPLFCDICSVRVHNLITDWHEFFKRLSVLLNCPLFIDSDDKGYIISIDGTIHKTSYEEEFVDGLGCVFIISA